MFQKLFYYNRTKYENFLEDKESTVWKIWNFVLDFSVIISILVIVFESIKPYSSIYSKHFFLITFTISSIFLLDYLYRLFRARDKKIFFRSILNFVDLLSFLPFFLSMIFVTFFSAWFFAIFRILRVFRILRLLRNIPLTIWFFQTLKNYKDEYKAIFLMFWIIIFVVSVLVYEIENSVNPEFSSIAKSLWWWIVTAATVGYGDMYPITPMWKIIWTIVILLWPALLAIIGSLTIMVFTEVAHIQEKVKKWKIKICPYCELESQIEANYCYNCWKKFNPTKK